mmetsp:Transcript_19857/g.45716  ORF Transcript_19857/g.45716 Transcript_19857/m.45716 type:complete len:92 (-) Transcript_19857:194-469(-)
MALAGGASSEEGGKGELLEQIVALAGSGDDAEALSVLSQLSAGQMTELVRDASNWAFKLDLQERIEQVRANDMGMLEDGSSASLGTGQPRK